MKNAALAVRDVGTSRSAASDAIVSVPGVATSSTGSGSSASGADADPRDLLVGRVAARVAQDERVLAVLVEDHELVGARAAHDPDVGADRDRLEAEPGEDPLVGAVVQL